ncbi:Hypothetical protein PHPALM_2261 [Phytophthora palmivora]|uniref:Uncharacterized protein n=1 Tax=Phytophthora palmivora TaxID=4796 RepID=A0A2P4YQE2_9STRA|nr:Hypothetical protein PHPALM_2261 [Phytophthora palmivora]
MLLLPLFVMLLATASVPSEAKCVMTQTCVNPDNEPDYDACIPEAHKEPVGVFIPVDVKMSKVKPSKKKLITAMILEKSAAMMAMWEKKTVVLNLGQTKSILVTIKMVLVVENYTMLMQSEKKDLSSMVK